MFIKKIIHRLCLITKYGIFSKSKVKLELSFISHIDLMSDRSRSRFLLLFFYFFFNVDHKSLTTRSINKLIREKSVENHFCTNQKDIISKPQYIYKRKFEENRRKPHLRTSKLNLHLIVYFAVFSAIIFMFILYKYH